MTAPTASTSLPPLQLLSAHKCHGGQVQFVRHLSSTTLTPMTFSVFIPPQAQAGPVPVLYFLSGLSCTAENFTTKAAAQKYCAQHGLLLVAPDTSPRGAGVPTEDDSYDLGTGAGFYVNATEAPWAPRYRMYDYVTRELPALIAAHFPARGPSFDLWTLDGRAWGADLRAEKSGDVPVGIGFCAHLRAVAVPVGTKSLHRLPGNGPRRLGRLRRQRAAKERRGAGCTKPDLD